MRRTVSVSGESGAAATADSFRPRNLRIDMSPPFASIVAFEALGGKEGFDFLGMGQANVKGTPHGQPC
jgi:hypothetical protein